MTHSTVHTRRLVSHVAGVARDRGYPTRRALANATGLTWSTIDRWWEQVPEMLYMTTLETLCNILEAQPGELVEWQHVGPTLGTLTCQDLAERWNVSARLVANLAAAGELLGERSEGQWIFTEEQAADYISRHTVSARGTAQ